MCYKNSRIDFYKLFERELQKHLIPDLKQRYPSSFQINFTNDQRPLLDIKSDIYSFQFDMKPYLDACWDFYQGGIFDLFFSDDCEYDELLSDVCMELDKRVS